MKKTFLTGCCVALMMTLAFPVYALEENAAVVESEEVYEISQEMPTYDASYAVSFVADAINNASEVVKESTASDKFVQAYEDLYAAYELYKDFTDTEKQQVAELTGKQSISQLNLDCYLLEDILKNVSMMYVPYVNFVNTPNKNTAKEYFDVYYAVIADPYYNTGNVSRTVEKYISDIHEVFRKTASYLPAEDIVVVRNAYFAMQKALKSGTLNQGFKEAYASYSKAESLYKNFTSADKSALLRLLDHKGPADQPLEDMRVMYEQMGKVLEMEEVYSAYLNDQNVETATTLVDFWDELYGDTTIRNCIYKFFKDIDSVYIDARAVAGNSTGIPFKDVPPYKWFYGSVKWAYEKGLLTGISDTEFAPNEPMTRGMIVTVLYRMEERPEVNGDAVFADVNLSKYYAKGIEWAASENIVSGYTNGNFGPEDSITREQLAKILYRYAEYKGYDVTASKELTGFSDASKVASYAEKYMKWAVAEELIQGSNGKLNPKGNATRAEIAAILKRFVEKYEVQ